MTHLILHKVRGEPAFDIAERLQIGDEEGWIIPTSGHRAYPYWNWRLDGLVSPFPPTDMPADWPDHYEVDTGSQPKANFNILSIISPMMKPFKRRL